MTHHVNFMADVRFAAGMIWGVTFVFGAWFIMIFAEPMKTHPTFFLMLAALSVWGMTWTSSLKTQGWCMRCAIMIKENRKETKE